jgi:processive 1,2-diacylglycerol beta-glucosyltransferase
MPAFGTQPGRTECAAEYGLDPQRTTILLMGGGAGLGSLDKVAEQLLTIPGEFQLIVLAGRNAEALTSLQQLATRYPGRLFPQGFTNKVERLMACADLVVTKPGGLSTSECLAMGLPMILNAPIPGQEERNADYLLEQGAALKACDAVTLEYRIRLLLGDPARLAKMRENAIALGKPRATAQVLQTVMAEIS